MIVAVWVRLAVLFVRLRRFRAFGGRARSFEGIAQDRRESPDGLGAADYQRGPGSPSLAEEFGDPVDRGHERQDVQVRAAGDQGADVMVVGPPHGHEPSSGRVLLGGPGPVGVGSA